MASSPDHYAALGVRPDADAADIRRAWIRAARANHPDRRGDASPEQTASSDRRMRTVNEAWRVLGNAELRRTYDQSRAVGSSRPSEPSSPTKPTPPSHGGFEDSQVEPEEPWPPGGAGTVEPGGPGGFVVRHRSAALVVRVLPWLLIAVVGLVIFVASAYMTASGNAERSAQAALRVGECYWTAPDGSLVAVACTWPQNDGVLDQIITMSSGDRCRHRDAVVHESPIAGRRLCLVPIDRWEPPANE